MKTGQRQDKTRCSHFKNTQKTLPIFSFVFTDDVNEAVK